MLPKLELLFNTVRHLKPKQIQYQLKYRLQEPKSFSSYKEEVALEQVRFLSFMQMPPIYSSYIEENHFSFLNITHDFKSEIDWDYQEYGKLWNYNLQYANYLLQKDVTLEEKLRLLRSLYLELESGNLKLEPYPVSLRTINTIRLLSKEKIKDRYLLENLYAELNFLSQRPEYHLLGNHLLENAFALLMGGAFFSELKWIKQGQKIVQVELAEQILADGAHFELSPMYHQIILFRLLELYDWYSEWYEKESQFEAFLKDKAENMLSWIKNISFKDGSIPHFNDSTDGIAFPTRWLLEYGKSLELSIPNRVLSDSGYRCINMGEFELRIDLAQIGPTYQPGHAHADNLSFVLNYNNQPIIVDTGISTYEKNTRRHIERSTVSHNTVSINGGNSSQVWSGFRVGKRAKTQIIEDKHNFLEASHNGFKGKEHIRCFQQKQSYLLINDLVKSADVEDSVEGHLHFHPDVQVNLLDTTIVINNQLKLVIKGAKRIELEDYMYASGYNRLHASKKLIYGFDKEVEIIIMEIFPKTSIE